MKNIKPHVINLGDLQDWIDTIEVTYASNLPLKKLNITVIWQGMQPYTAVEKYNELF